MINGISDHRLEEIELRLVGCDHRPWKMSDEGQCDDEGRRLIMKGSRKSAKKASRAAVQRLKEEPPSGLLTGGYGQGTHDTPFDLLTLRRKLTLFKRTENATDDMMTFVSHAPQDVEDLLREIKQLRIMCTKLKEERHNAVQELQGTKVAASRAEEKISDMRRAWRTMVKEMGTRP